MSKKQSSQPPYAPEFRRQLIDLVRAGRSPEDLAREFEPSAQTIRNWVGQSERDDGRRSDGVTSAEREELLRLRRENRQLKLKREILSIGEPASKWDGDPFPGERLVCSGDEQGAIERWQFPVTGFGCRPIANVSTRTTGPAFESRQGTKSRAFGHPTVQQALWGFRWHGRRSGRWSRSRIMRRSMRLQAIMLSIGVQF